MKYARFKTEDELVRSVLHSLSYDTYPKVSAVGGKRIFPDIDILQIQEGYEPRPIMRERKYYRLIGYEVKLMKFDKRSKRLSWSSFYNGIGQALLYLKNGIHHSVLVLGFHDTVPNDELIDEFYNWLRDNKDLLKRAVGNYLSIDVYLYERGSILPLIEASSDFYPYDEKVQLLSNEMLHKKLTFSRKLKSD